MRVQQVQTNKKQKRDASQLQSDEDMPEKWPGQQHLTGCARTSPLAFTGQASVISYAPLPPSLPSHSNRSGRRGTNHMHVVRGRSTKIKILLEAAEQHEHTPLSYTQKKKRGAPAPHTCNELTPDPDPPVELRVSRLHSDGVRGCPPLPSRYPSAAPVLCRRGVQGEAQDIRRHQQSQKGNQQRSP